MQNGTKLWISRLPPVLAKFCQCEVITNLPLVVISKNETPAPAIPGDRMKNDVDFEAVSMIGNHDIRDFEYCLLLFSVISHSKIDQTP